jgi:hypothetical protein
LIRQLVQHRRNRAPRRIRPTGMSRRTILLIAIGIAVLVTALVIVYLTPLGSPPDQFFTA